MANRDPKMAYDSTDYPGSPWKGRAGRVGQAFDLSRAVWVPGKATPSIEAENARRVALFLATNPGNSYLK